MSLFNIILMRNAYNASAQISSKKTMWVTVTAAYYDWYLQLFLGGDL